MIGDSLAQSTHGEVVPQRVAWLGLFGLTVYGPTSHTWFGLQERYVTVYAHRPLAQAVVKVRAPHADTTSFRILYTRAAGVRAHEFVCAVQRRCLRRLGCAPRGPAWGDQASRAGGRRDSGGQMRLVVLGGTIVVACARRCAEYLRSLASWRQLLGPVRAAFHRPPYPAPRSHASNAGRPLRYMLVLYRFCPVQHRVLATATGNLGWSTYLSLKSRFKPDKADGTDPE